MNAPRILIVGNFLSRHGASRGVCEELAPRLRQTGCSVITTSSQYRPLIRLADMLATIWTRRHEYDVAQVDVYSGPAFRWAEAACSLLRRIGRPYVLTLHGGSLPDFARREESRVRRLLESASAVTAPSSYLLNQMAGYRRDLILLPNGLEVEHFDCRVPKAGVPTVIWLRAFHAVYNPVMAVKAVARLKDEFPSLRLVMAGPDKGDGTRQQVERSIREYRAESLVQLHGAIPKQSVPEFLSDGHIFVNTTNVDNTPVTVLEAMAARLCVVSTNVGGIPYLLKSNRDALLVPPENDTAMAIEIRRLITNPALADSLRAEALAKVRKFDWGKVLLLWREVLAASSGRMRASGPAFQAPTSASVL